MEKLPENVCTRNYCYSIWNMGKKKPATTSQIVAGSFLKREKRAVTTPFGKVEVKVCIFDGQEYFYPEYESVKKLCEKTGISYKEAYHMAVRG